MICPNCKKEIEEDSNFCSYCNFQIVSDEVKEKNTELPKGNALNGVEGWLLIFILITLISGVKPLMDTLLSFAKGNGFTILDLILNTGFLVFSIYVVICLSKRKRNAIKTVKIYLIIMIILGTIAVFFAPTHVKPGQVISSALWLLYFLKSKRVKNTYSNTKNSLSEASS